MLQMIMIILFGFLSSDTVAAVVVAAPIVVAPLLTHFPPEQLLVRLQWQPVATPLSVFQRLSDSMRSFQAIAIEPLTIALEALAIAIGVLP